MSDSESISDLSTSTDSEELFDSDGIPIEEKEALESKEPKVVKVPPRRTPSPATPAAKKSPAKRSPAKRAPKALPARGKKAAATKKNIDPQIKELSDQLPGITIASGSRIDVYQDLAVILCPNPDEMDEDFKYRSQLTEKIMDKANLTPLAAVEMANLIIYKSRLGLVYNENIEKAIKNVQLVL